MRPTKRVLKGSPLALGSWTQGGAKGIGILELLPSKLLLQSHNFWDPVLVLGSFMIVLPFYPTSGRVPKERSYRVFTYCFI